jgi:hypothetical protein
MVPGVVQHQDEPPLRAAMPQQDAEKDPERDRVELRAELGHELPGAEVDRAEERHGLPRRGVEQHRVGLFRGHPHATPGTMLLEMAFVEAPEVKAVGASEPAEFF